MIPFLILFLYLVIIMISTYNRAGDDKTRVRVAILCGLGLWILMALRSWTCGKDLYYSEKGAGYIIHFLDIGSSSFYENIHSGAGYEPGFRTLFWLIFNFISPNPQFMLAIVSGLEILLIGYTFFKQSPNIALSYIAFACLGLYIFSYSGLRQGLCIAITFFAFNFIDERRPWRFFMLILLGATIHMSSVIFIPAYFVKDLSLSRKKAVAGIVGVFLFLPFLMGVIQFFSVLLYGKEKYSSYEGGAYNLLILYILLLLFSYYVDSKKLLKNRKITQVRWMSLIAIFLQSSGILSAGALSRIAFSYSIFFSLLLPYTVSVAAPKNRRQLEFLIVFLLICFFIYVNKDGYLNVIPYRFFWDEVYQL